jgi:hypothetical protein
MKHVEPSRLFSFAEGETELHPTERGHMATCADCRQVLEVFKTYLIDNSQCEKVDK